MELPRKLEILADAAKYDASCASSGAARKDSRGSGGVGSTGGAGICHSYTPDGRCVSLLKVLLTNILQRADTLYTDYKLRRVYYSGFSPIPEPSSLLPVKPPPLVREHRLYQADWLLRFYHFKVDEITTAAAPNLDLALDPKLSWALRNRAWFPVDVNRASREELLRIPGLGVRNVERILAARRYSRLRLADLVLLRLSMKKIMPFIIAADHTPTLLDLDGDSLRQRFLPPPRQMELNFDNPQPTVADVKSTLSGESKPTEPPNCNVPISGRHAPRW